ncbi:MAG: DUF4287 domain-containing protein [Piscinibacter sp.]|jgi:hypothetical protein|nr:DUF4287 domain-containing protein [Piscinibacter sp.]
MADPTAATSTQLRNIESRTGKGFAELCRLIADSGHAKVSDQRRFLMDTLGLGYGDANTLALLAKAAAAPAAPGADPLDAIYAGAKAPLRGLHEQLMAEIGKLGDFEIAPKKSYVSLRRKKQFAMLGPATKDALELGLNAKDLAPAARLKTMPPGGMCPYAVRLGTPAEIDAELLGWVRAAFAAAG